MEVVVQQRLLQSVCVAVGLVLVGSVPATAQSVALGPRFTHVRGDLTTGTPSSTLLGGTLRMRSSSLTALELSMDYRVTRNDEGTERVRETPLQASLLLMPFRSALSPYALGGIGVYSRKLDTLGLEGEVTDSSLTRRVGWHAGFGAEIRLGRHAAVYGDYRYQFVKFGKKEPEGDSIIPGWNRVAFSHQGSMWTGGFAFYF